MNKLADLEYLVEAAWSSEDQRAVGSDVREAVMLTIAGLDAGTIRLAERVSQGEWRVNEWVRKAIMLSFAVTEPHILRSGDIAYIDDRSAYKFSHWSAEEATAAGMQIHAPSIVRRGAYIGKRTIVIAGYVAIGAYVGDGTVVDGFVNVGSGAQIGESVHLSAGTCIGGVLEPVQARPVIIEDRCFIGANTSIVEGVIVEEGSVIGMGVQLGQSTKIFDRATRKVSYGRIPAGSLVMPGTLADPSGLYSTPCAIIVKTVDQFVRSKTAVNEILRWRESQWTDLDSLPL